MSLQLVPSEVTEQILAFCRARDVAHVALTCKQFHSLIYETDQHLWRALFLSYPFDDLRKSPIPSLQGINWKTELQARVFAETVIISGTARGDELRIALETLVSVADAALPFQSVPSRAPDATAPPSDNLTWLYSTLQRSPVIHRALTGPEQQLCCKIRSYIALTLKDEAGGEPTNRLNTLRSVSRCAVYDLRNYSAPNLWGPYLPLKVLTPHAQPKVDWVHVEHIMNVVAMNMRDLEDTPYASVIPHLGLEATRAYSAPGTLDCKGSEDWAGVDGLWRRIVCFMDYRELVAFNFASLHGSLSPTFFDDPNFIEAVRLLEMRLSLVEVDEITEFDYPGCPQLHFHGLVRGLRSTHAEVTGFVRRFLDGTIRWNFHTIYDGVPQWSGECIQIGNVCSAAGLAGIWSGVNHDAGDPAGPFLMWKISERK